MMSWDEAANSEGQADDRLMLPAALLQIRLTTYFLSGWILVLRIANLELLMDSYSTTLAIV